MSLIGKPLYSLLRKGKVWNRDAACQKAFEELLSRLVREPVSLAHPKWNKEFYVEADASSTGVTAILSQLDENTRKLRPIQFFSSALSASQKNYSAGQLEAWALVATTRKWSVYLKGAPSIVLLTDHCPLQWLQTQKDPKRTYARWLMELQELPFRIGYRPGRENVVADYLSRSPALNVDEEVNHDVLEEKVFHTMGPEDLYERMGKQQLQDDTIRTALEQLRRGNAPTGQFRRVRNRLEVRGGVLRFQNRVIVPPHLRRETIEVTHCQHHFGQAATLDSLKKHFFWPQNDARRKGVL